MTSATPPAEPAGPPSAMDLLRSRNYLALLLFAAIIGAPVALASYFFLVAVDELQEYLFADLPGDLGFGSQPAWWPLPLLALGGLIVGLAVKYLPGNGGHKPAEGFVATPPDPVALPGVAVAALATLSFGAVLGPEAPLIAIGGCLGVIAIRLANRDAPAQASAVMGAAGSFAAISTLLGSPIVGAFLLMEVAGLAGPMIGVVLVPGLLAAGIGSLIFIGLDSWTGLGTFSLAVPSIPSFGTPDVTEFFWEIGIGAGSALLGVVIGRSALALQFVAERRVLLLTPVAGVVVAALAIAFAQVTDKPVSDVLFSGQEAIGPLIQNAGEWSVGALLLLVLCKGIAYSVSLSSFRGGPIFPALFIGAAGGILASHLPGLPMIAGAAMGMGAMTVAMLGLPLTAVLITSLLLLDDAVTLMPLVIVSVVVSYVVSAWLKPPKEPAPVPEVRAAGAAAAAS